MILCFPRKPGFIYATDADKYNNGRGLYYSLTSTPFPVASNNDEMIKILKTLIMKPIKMVLKSF